MPGLRISRKHIGWYSKGLTNSSEFRATVNNTDDAEKTRELIKNFYTDAARGGDMSDKGLSASVERHLRDYFAAHENGLPCSGLYDRVLQEIERPLLSYHSGGMPRQPIARGGIAGPQPQYAAQENPRTWVWTRAAREKTGRAAND